MKDYLIWIAEELEKEGYEFWSTMEAIADGRMDVPEHLSIDRYLNQTS